MSPETIIIPFIIMAVILTGIIKKVSIFSEFTEGAKENLRCAAELIPSLVALITAVGMYRASGASDIMTSMLSDAAQAAGFPPECIPLALIRPVSGSGALAVYESIISEYGPDSFPGLVSSVMTGATETTFYTAAVYFGAVGIRNIRHTIGASLAGDMTGFIFSVLTVDLLLR